MTTQQFFRNFRNKPIPLRLDSPWGSRAARREYLVNPLTVVGSQLTAEVSWKDFDRNDVPVQRFPATRQTLDLNSVRSPGEAVEAMCRAADPKAWTRASKDDSGPADPSETLEHVRASLEALRPDSARKDGEAPPNPDSVTRLLAFLRAVPDAVPPAVFSSKDGTLRARWNHGPDRTVFVAFPKEGPLPITVTFPRIGNYGLVRAQCRVIDDQDVPQFLATLSIRITRS